MVKANFDDLYSVYTPSGYVQYLVKDLHYHLPFLAMEKIAHYCTRLLPQDRFRVTVIGSSYGLDAVALKYDLGPDDILERWTNESTVLSPLPKSGSQFELTLVDIESEPLRFAHDINLSDHSFVANLNQDHPTELSRHLAEKTDIISAIGVTSYLDLESVDKILQTAFVDGDASIFYFSLLKYLDVQAFIDSCNRHGLYVRFLGDVAQRLYKDNSEKQRVHETLKSRAIFGEPDETDLMASLFIAYRPLTDQHRHFENSSRNLSGHSRKDTPQTLVVTGKGNILTGSMTSRLSTVSANWPHPWHVALSREDSKNPAVLQNVTELHLKGELQPGDTITTASNASSDYAEHWTDMFAGEYSIDRQIMANGSVRQITTRVVLPVNANIVGSIPASAADLATELDRCGHLLVRGGSAIGEEDILRILSGDGEVMDYRYGNAARKQVEGSSAVEVTPWPKELGILPHSELTYHPEFPGRVAFVCKEPAAFGGETPIYDCALAFDHLAPELQAKAERHNVIFRKRYVESNNHERYPGWQQVLGKNTTPRHLMDHFVSLGYHCKQLDVEENGEIITVVETQLIRPAVYEYQGRKCLHSSIVGIAPYWYEKVWQGKEQPLTVTWDDGTAIAFDELRQLEQALHLARINYNNWQRHDLLILDNLRIAHGRMPFIGNRVVEALMACPSQFVNQDEGWKVEPVDPGTASEISSSSKI